MPYRITSLERIDGASLPSPIPAGGARWRATVDFWYGKADGPPQITDDIILDTATQRMRPKSGDEWELMSKEETLATALAEVITEREPHYMALVWAGVRGYRATNESANQHGTVKPADEIAHHSEVRKLVGVVKEVGQP